MSRTKRLHQAATRTVYRRGMYIHGEFIGVILSFFVLFTLSLIASQPSIHSDYNVFNPSSGDVSVNYAITQQPTFVINSQGFKGKIATTVTTLDGRSANVQPVVSQHNDGSDDFSVALVPTAQPEPGRYKIIVTMSQGKTTKIVTQDFTWGVLALNMAKSSYQPHENVGIGMAVLDDNGITLCSANTKLEITAPDGRVTTLTTAAKQIIVSDTCKDGNVTNSPDYMANYTPDQTGSYDVRMTTTTIRGMRSMDSSFDVVNHADFVSERVNTAMRLYPSSPYNVTLNVRANKSFSGSFDEPLPDSFAITNPKLTDVKSNGQRIAVPNSRYRVDVQGSTRILHWDGLLLDAGDTVQLTYTYKPPAISPAFYQLGVASLTDSSGNKVFQEPRAWQLAGDAVNDVIVLWDTANGAIPSGWTCVSCLAGDDFYQRFPYINTTYAGTGGGPESVTHTYANTAATAGTATANINTLGGGTAVPTAAHTHTWPAPVIGSTDIKPPYKDLQFIKASNPLGLPQNAIAMFDVASTASLPTNWASYAALNDPGSTGTAGNGVYLRGENDAVTGGASTHTHTRALVTSGTNTGTVNIVTGTSATIANTGHTHTLAAGTTPTDNNNPLYASVVFAKLGVDQDAIPNGMIAMFDSATMPTGWTQTTTLGGTAVTGHLIKGTINDTAGTPIGGVTTHNHGGTQVITSSAPSLTRQVAAAGLTNTTSGTSTHTHNVTYSISAGNSMPNYRSVILGKFATVNYTGTVYTDEGTTPQATAVTVKASINGGAQRSTTTAVTTGTFTLPMPDPGAGADVTIWLDTNGGVSGTRVTRANSGAISGMNIYENRLVVTHEDAGPISNADLAKCTKSIGTVCGGVTAEGDLHFDVASSNLTVDNDTRLYVNAAKTFTPGGNVTLSPGGTAASMGGDLKFGSSTSTLNIGTNTLNVGGDWDNSVNGAFTKTSSQTTTMTGTVAGLTVNAGTNASNHFDKLTFNGSPGSWTFASAVTSNIDSDLTVTNGTVVAPSAAAMTVGGNFSNAGAFTAPGTSNSLNVAGNWTNTATFTHNSGVVTFTSTATGNTINPGASNFNNVTFNGSGGGWSPVTNQLTVLGDLTMTAGTLGSSTDSADIIVNGNAVGTAGIIN
ncbi:MAG: hypothetical protein JWO07_684, partial [Candidatus Saccharibacteria bacterium]|nr:hypothetical protein [Candidatus Saccharibacteria bacterium]